MLPLPRRSSLLAWSVATFACGAISHASGQTVSIHLWSGNDPAAGGTWMFDSSTLTPNVYHSNDIHDVRYEWYDHHSGPTRLTDTAGAPLADVSFSYFYEILYQAYLPYVFWGQKSTHDQGAGISVTSLVDGDLHGFIRISYPSEVARPSASSPVVDDIVSSLSASVRDTDGNNVASLAGMLPGSRLMQSTFSVPSAGTGTTAWLAGPGDAQGQRSYFRALLNPQDPWSGLEPAEVFTDIGFTLSPLDSADFSQSRTLPNPGAAATFAAAGLMLTGRRRRRIESR